MLKKLLVLALIINVISCDTDSDMEKGKRHEDNTPLTVLLDTISNVGFNPITNVVTKTMLNDKGDTVVTGVPVPFQFGRVENIDTCYLKSDSITMERKSLAESENEVKPILKSHVEDLDITITAVEINLLGGEINKGHFLLNEFGDSVFTGTPLKIEGTNLGYIHPIISKSLPVESRDVTTKNIKILSQNQGLINNSILCSMKDSRGAVWIGHDGGGGCTVYDGAYLKVYDNKSGFPSSTVRCLYEDSNGNIWLGTNNGIVKFDGITFTYYGSGAGLVNDEIWDIIELDNGNIVFASAKSGIILYDGTSFILTTDHEGLQMNRVQALKKDPNDGFWAGCSGNQLLHFKASGVEEFKFPDFQEYQFAIHDIEIDGEGSLWFSTGFGGVIKVLGATGEYYNSQSGFTDALVWTIFTEENGEVWFGTWGDGMFKLNEGKFKRYSQENGLSYNIVLSIQKESDGILWAGTWGGGMNIINENSFQLFNARNGGFGQYVWDTYADDLGRVWYAHDEGVILEEGDKYDHLQFKFYESLQTIRSTAADDQGNVFFGSWGSSILKYDGTNIYRLKVADGSSIKDLEFDEITGDLIALNWTNGFDLIKFTDTLILTEHIDEDDGLMAQKISCVKRDNQNRLWVGTKNGFSVIENDFITNYGEQEGFFGKGIYSFEFDEYGNVLMATLSAGLCVFDGEKFTYLTENDGLTSNNLTSLYLDEENNCWVGSSKGINKISFKGNPIITDRSNFNVVNFGRSELIPPSFYTTKSLSIDKDNVIRWGTGKGAVALSLNDYSESPQPISLDIVNLKINGNEVRFDSITNETLEIKAAGLFNNYPDQLKLNHDQNHVSFSFSAIDWLAPQKIDYSYRLVGYDDEWTSLTSQTEADFKNLYHGDYAFEIKAQGDSGNWSEIKTYKFTILPPWWHTWWARVLYALLLVAGVYLLIRWRTKKLLKRQEELENQVEAAVVEIKAQKTAVESQKAQIEEQHLHLEETHKEISDSINYARHLQQAILPSQEEIKKYLQASFVLFKPKHIVSGDFYWLQHIGNYTYFAAADCTGHGVPGAMVSVVCSNALNRSVKEFKLTAPNQILDKTRELVIETFAKSGKDVKDGMDIALCRIGDGKLVYCGANNPLWIVRNTEYLSNEEKELRGTMTLDEISLIEFKANKQPIGLYEGMKDFEQHEIDIFKGDVLYIFSDGYADQFGGEKGKKLKYRPFKEYLLQMSGKDADVQHDEINRLFEEWKGDFEQVDDICLIGVKLADA